MSLKTKQASTNQDGKTLSKEERIQELWRRGNLAYKLKPVQQRLRKAFHGIKLFLFVALVARQTGKSFYFVLQAIETCLQKPKARVRYGTAFYTDLEEFIQPIFNLIIEDAPEDCKPKWNGHKSKWIFPNKAEIRLFGLDKNPNGVRGNALDLVIIDEAAFVRHLRKVYNIIIFMLRHRPQLKVIMCSSAPEEPDHEFVEFIEQARADGTLFEATIDDDETCDDETKERIFRGCGGKDSPVARRECYNEIIVDEELAIVPEWSEKYVQEVKPDDFFKFYHKYTGMDIGGTKTTSDFTANIFGYYDFMKATLFIQDECEIVGPQSTTEAIAKMVRDKEETLWPQEGTHFTKRRVYLRIGDNNNQILLNDLGADKHGLPFIATNKDELHAMVNKVRTWVKSGRIIVDPKCIHLIGGLKGGIYNDKKEKKEFARSKTHRHYDHLAALIYLVRNIDEHTNPIPADLGLSYHTHHIRGDLKPLSDTAKVMNQVTGKKFTKGLKH